MKWEIRCKCGKPLIIISEHSPGKHFHCVKCRRDETEKTRLWKENNYVSNQPNC